MLTSLEIADSSELEELNAAVNHEHREVYFEFWTAVSCFKTTASGAKSPRFTRKALKHVFFSYSGASSNGPTGGAASAGEVPRAAGGSCAARATSIG